MASRRLTIAGKAAAAVLAAGVPALAGPVDAAPVETAAAACALVKTRVSARGDFPISKIAFCDAATGAPTGYYVLALHGRGLGCGGICGSTNMGWFAVQKASGRVFEWDVGEYRLGQPIGPRP